MKRSHETRIGSRAIVQFGLLGLVLWLGPATRGDDVSAFVRWAKEQAIPLRSAEAGHGFDDLEPAKAFVGDAKIVALGESTHGTREVFQMKHRMLEFLVREKGFTLFAIEAGMPECAAINDYVLHGEGDAAAALRGLGYWPWDTEEVLELIRWMRRYNADPAHAKKVKFYGFDMQSPGASFRFVLDYLEPHAPGLVARVGTAIEPYIEKLYYLLYRELSDDFRTTYDRAVAELTEHLDREREALIAGTSRDAWAMARRQIDLLHQAEAQGRAAIASQPKIGSAAFRKLAAASKSTAAELNAYLGEYDPDLPRDLREFLAGVADAEGAVTKGYRRSAVGADPSRRWDVLASRLVERIEGEKPGLVRRSSQQEWDRSKSQAADLATLMEAAREIHARPQAEPNVRDLYMAENVAWILEREGPDAKIVTWAHNWHVLKEASPGAGRMGTELERIFGDPHFVIGFAFNRGGFQARGLDRGRPGTSVLQEFVVGPAKPGSIDRALAEVGPPRFLLDLRGLVEDAQAASWAATARPLRDVPAGFDPDEEATYYIDSALSREFDAVIFMEQTSRARPNSRPEPRLGEPVPDVPIGMLNLGFETVTAGGGLPEGWSVGPGSEGYSIAADDAVRESGGRSLRIRREGQGKSGIALRVLPAAKLAGKTVCVRGMVRTEGITRGYAGLLIRAEAPGKLLAMDNSAIRVDSNGGRSASEFRGLLGTADWRELSLELATPPSATVLRVGPILTGNGTAWFDRLSIEIDGQPYNP